MYKSPIEIAYGQLQTKFEGDVVKAVQSYNISVDKEELIKALAYDRDQYEAGYRDAMATIVHCKDCVYSDAGEDPITGNPIRLCNYGVYRQFATDEHYCSHGWRKGEGE